MANKFVTFLKKVGLGIVKYAPAVLGISQIVATTDPKAQPIVDRLGAIFAAGMQIEKDFAVALPGQQTGPQKILALSAQVEDILRQSELASGQEIGDEVLFGKGAQEIAQGVVDAMQALKGKDGSTVTAI